MRQKSSSSIKGTYREAAEGIVKDKEKTIAEGLNNDTEDKQHEDPVLRNSK